MFGVIFQLEPTKNLVSQCVQGSGMVQINVEVKSQPGTGTVYKFLFLVSVVFSPFVMK